jgi:hypothetical protein
MADTDYRLIRTASMREVVEHFVTVESTRAKYAGLREQLHTWRDLDDTTLFARIRDLADTRDDVNPTLTWTIGTGGNNHHERVERWVLAEVRLNSLFSCGINEATRADLESVQGNLALFAPLSTKYPEFQSTAVQDGERRPIIVVAHVLSGRAGTIEVIDGVHRAVAMVRNGIVNTSAFLGQLKSKG